MLLVATTAFLLAARLGPAAEAIRDEAAIADVLAGRTKTAHASWWGFAPADSTAALQAAIDSGVPQLVIDRQNGPWIVNEIRLRSNQELVFEPGVLVLAKKGEFRATGAALFSAIDCRDLTLRGLEGGATVRMHRDDYAQPPYQKAEWRHALSLRGCENVLVENLTLAESGGDGIYLGRGRKNVTNRKVTIRNVVCERNYRQGISVIAAEDLLIEKCVLKDTAGTPPAAGIDFEPNRSDEGLVRCVMRNCLIENNQGHAIHIYARNLTGATPDVSIRLEDCTTRGSNARSLSVVTSNGGPEGSLHGRIDLVNCRFEDCGKAGIVVGSKPAEGIPLKFRDCLLADAADEPTSTPPIVLNSRLGDREDLGGIEFVNFTIRQRTETPLLRVDDRAGLAVRGITGTMTVVRGEQREQVELNQATLDRLIPANPFVRVPAFDTNGVTWEPAAQAAATPQALPPHRLRDAAVFWVSAAADETVTCRLRHQRVGRDTTGGPMPVQVLTPSGKEVATAQVPLDQESPVTFRASEAGVYRFICQPRHHTARMLSCSHPVSLSGDGRTTHFIATPGDFYFWVPAGVKKFAVRAQGEGDGERIGVALLDPAGRTVWNEPNLGGAEYHFVTRATEAPGEVWRIRLAKAPEGVLGDHYVELRGVPPILSFTPETILHPTPAAPDPHSLPPY